MTLQLWSLHIGDSQTLCGLFLNINATTLCANACTYPHSVLLLTYISGSHCLSELSILQRLSLTPLICLPLRLSLCCCPSLSQTFDTPVAAITIANVWSVRSNLSYHFKQDRRKGRLRGNSLKSGWFCRCVRHVALVLYKLGNVWKIYDKFFI